MASSGESLPLMLAYYIHDLSPFVLRFSENYGVRWYGLAYVAAFFIGILIVRRLSQLGYCDIPPQKVSDFIIGSAIFGVLLGGRLGYMLFYDLQNFLSQPARFLSGYGRRDVRSWRYPRAHPLHALVFLPAQGLLAKHWR